MELTGEILGIIYQNEINSYTIAEIYANELEKIETIVGYLPFIAEGDEVKLIGKIVEHKEYGEQFKVDSFEKLMPQSLEALERYLGNGTIKGVGPATARKIVETFGDETLDILKYDPSKLQKVRGISSERALEIAESFMESWGVWQIVEFLKKFNIGIENAKRIYDKLGAMAIETIEENPYVLIDLVRGVNFKQIDDMALKLGIEAESLKRITSGIKYALIQISYNGHSCAILQNLEEFVINLLGISIDDVESGIIHLKAKGEIVIEDRDDDTEWVYLESFYNTEVAICNRLNKLDETENSKKVKGIKNEMKRVEKENGIELSEKQKEAVQAVNDNNVTIITGGPGTGKTTIIKSIIEIYIKQNNKIVLAAPTGRAAKRMTEATGYEAMTIHRMLEINGEADRERDMKKGNASMFERNEGNPLETDVIIIDEMSMVDLYLMNALLQAMVPGTRLIIVGDANQLPSIGAGNVLKDMIASGQFKVVELNQIFRQEEGSHIVRNAHLIHQGRPVELDNKSRDFFFLQRNNIQDVLGVLVYLVRDKLPGYVHVKPYDIQILTPMRKGELGVERLNQVMQQYLNPPSDEKKEKEIAFGLFREGDKVMQIKNNYQIEWEMRNSKGFTVDKGVGVFNGDMGIITEINDYTEKITVLFDETREVQYPYATLDELELAYAVTIHKSQGSEYPAVVMPILSGPRVLFHRNLLYTGVTRAKNCLTIVGDRNMLFSMIQNVNEQRRYTTLALRLDQIANESEEIGPMDDLGI